MAGLITLALVGGLALVSRAREQGAAAATVAPVIKTADDVRRVPEFCPGARDGLTFWKALYSRWRAVQRLSPPPPTVRYPCDATARRASEWRDRARIERIVGEAWLTENYRWSVWLPEKYARVGACETGYGRRPGNWNHDSGKFVSAFGIIRSAYDSFSRNLGYPGWDAGGRTPRQQYEVAAAVQRTYGWDAWGCGGA